MSQHESMPVTCGGCGAPFTVLVATSLNAVRAPSARQAVLDGTLHTFSCPGCGATHRIDADFGYMDVARRHWIAVCPATALGAWRTRESAARNAFSEVTDRAPSLWASHAVTMTVRCVFGLEALTEKLRVWDAGLDDAVVESWKLELLRDRPSLQGHWIRVESVEEQEVIFAVGEARFAGHRARYQVLLQTRDSLRRRRQELFRGPFVDARRLSESVSDLRASRPA